MNFQLSEEHQQIREMIRDFVKSEVIPHAREWDEAESFPHETVAKLGELGMLGVVIPEQYGGSELDMLSLALIIEEVARGDGSLALTVASHNGLGSGHILYAGNEEQRQKYIPRLATGEILGAWALTEPGSGSDAAGLLTKGEKVDGGWVLNGSKTFITQGSVVLYDKLGITPFIELPRYSYFGEYQIMFDLYPNFVAKVGGKAEYGQATCKQNRTFFLCIKKKIFLELLEQHTKSKIILQKRALKRSSRRRSIPTRGSRVASARWKRPTPHCALTRAVDCNVSRPSASVVKSPMRNGCV